MCNLPFLIRPVSSDGALEILANSMWSTMMITGLCFMSFLVVFLTVRVGRTASSETDPLEISFLFSLAGLRYLNNHVRHHLFETPLLPRRRFSSISTSWFPNFISRNFAANKDLFTEQSARNDTSGQMTRQKRSSSVSDHYHQQTARRASTSLSTSKGKRASVSNNSNSNANNSNSNSNNQHMSENKRVVSTTQSVHVRRNTLPNISLGTVSHASSASSSDNDLKLEDVAIFTTTSTSTPFMISETTRETTTNTLQTDTNQDHFRKNINIPNLAMPAIDEDEEEFSEEFENESFSEESEDELFETSTKAEDKNEDISTSTSTSTTQSAAISIPTPTSTSASVSGVAASPKSSYKSSYLNYLPESIFGYSTAAITQTKIPPSIVTPKFTENLSPPPGYTKRSASHDYSTPVVVATPATTDITEPFVSHLHQPLYARRRTESYRNTSHFSMASGSSLNASAPHFQPDIGVDPKVHLPSQAAAATIPKSVSPCLNDLNNTADLFAPINWNFTNSEQTEASRRSWSAIEAEEERQRRRSNVSSMFHESKSKFNSTTDIF